MLILIKTSIKTSIRLLLFTLAGMIFFAGNCSAVTTNETGSPKFNNEPENKVSGDFNAFNQFSKDTVKTGVTPEKNAIIQDEKFLIPARLANQPIDFQINSNITYLSFRNFVRDEAKKSFFQAWMKEKEVTALSAETDSLRNIYANSPDERKAELASVILKNEAKTLALNEEIPPLYQNARHLENDYWKTAPADELTRFQEKINLFRDSLAQVASRLKAQQEAAVKVVPDTIILPKQTPKVQEIKNEQPAGVIYKIQIGAFKGKVPVTAAKLIKKLSVIRQIENYMDEKGVTIYTTGNLNTWKEATIMQEQVKQEGVKNPTVIAYQNGKKIAVNEARKITHEL